MEESNRQQKWSEDLKRIMTPSIPEGRRLKTNGEIRNELSALSGDDNSEMIVTIMENAVLDLLSSGDPGVLIPYFNTSYIRGLVLGYEKATGLKYDVTTDAPAPEGAADRTPFETVVAAREEHLKTCPECQAAAEQEAAEQSKQHKGPIC